MVPQTLLLLALTLPAADPSVSQPPPLPVGVTVPGGAVLDGTVYIYGGHSGKTHHYSKQTQSNDFFALDLSNPAESEWRALPSGPRLQGLALVPHDGKIYRIGGSTAMNDKGEESNLQSQADVAVYDPETKKWTQLTDLPEPRSSLDADVLGDQVYVIGGWQLDGDMSGTWHETGWTADLSQRPLEWKPIAAPPLGHRRALAVEAYAGEIYVIGGMDDDGEVSLRVDIYDPKTDTWRRGPDLIAENEIAGFGPSAVGTESGLYVSSLSGTVQRLTKGAEEWKVVAQLEAPRFVHQMLAYDGKLYLIGGANRIQGKLTKVEVIELDPSVKTAGTSE